jgi:phosphatidate phosphatase APP1
MAAIRIMRMELRSALLGLDSFASRAQRQARRTLGRVENVRLVPYRGWVTRDKAVVLGRALLCDVALEERLLRGPRLLRVAYERFGTLETEPVQVQVAWQEQTAATTSDLGGFIDVTFPIGGTAPVGMTRAELTIVDAVGSRSVSADVFGLDPRASFGIISDIDDTVLETELSNPWKRALQLIYTQQRMRLPFDGIAALYRALSQPCNPIFYVSNAPWNLYVHVVELLDHHDIPKGPLFLRDSRIGERVVLDEPSGKVIVHKQRALRRIVEEHPGLSFVMLGDSSRRDPLRYIEIAEAYPGRVAAIYIRRVHGVLARRSSLDPLQERARRAGVELLIADDTVSIAQHAKSRGFVQPAEVERVREGQRRDERSPPTELTSVAAQPEKEPQ